MIKRLSDPEGLSDDFSLSDITALDGTRLLDQAISTLVALKRSESPSATRAERRERAAKEQKALAVLNVLLSHGADLLQRDARGSTAMDAAHFPNYQKDTPGMYWGVVLHGMQQLKKEASRFSSLRFETLLVVHQYAETRLKQICSRFGLLGFNKETAVQTRHQSVTQLWKLIHEAQHTQRDDKLISAMVSISKGQDPGCVPMDQLSEEVLRQTAWHKGIRGSRLQKSLIKLLKRYRKGELIAMEPDSRKTLMFKAGYKLYLCELEAQKQSAAEAKTAEALERAEKLQERAEKEQEKRKSSQMQAQMSFYEAKLREMGIDPALLFTQRSSSSASLFSSSSPSMRHESAEELEEDQSEEKKMG